MLVREYYGKRNDGVELYITYSDEGKKIRKLETGEVYIDAVDEANKEVTYEEIKENVDETGGEE